MHPAALALFLILLTSPTLAQGTRIYCPIPEHGIWVDPKAKPKQVSRIEVESRCIDDRVILRARAFMRCSPRDCKWGWTDASLRPGGGGVRVQLSGFFGSRLIDMRAFDGHLEAYVTEIPHDRTVQENVTSHILRRK
ncbi:hypothetical protein [Polymorphum gilvum]|uniref:Uncharacterized protein n=1 Tax=Polymorphum gilvum (strain LMG 25793 / CGMCC 1.9160 / SL003B-26A1) TaxID=991905 RepID=F2IVC4_POLGS|nr:hypothetical protein [Polymorphum gilvum]ADZ72642.1 hypothetical protein SL003B_4225 [Polymorphum gilvum SL003B-26A1]